MLSSLFERNCFKEYLKYFRREYGFQESGAVVA